MASPAKDQHLFGDHNGESPFAKEVLEGYAMTMMCEKSNWRSTENGDNNVLNEVEEWDAAIWVYECVWEMETERHGLIERRGRCGNNWFDDRDKENYHML